ncbi:MAG TPA: acyltransferase, partial [Blastocatellia bacterium]|nr:acyltransferase [Blastocatellia bacterium]
GYIGVSFFFVLSGFLITYLILAEVDALGSIDVKAFYIRRILRIWPLYYAVVVFAFLLYPALKHVAGFPGYIDTGKPLLYFAFLGNFDVINLGPGRGAMSTNITWSVCIEEQFYLIWPLMFLIVPRRFYKFIFPGIISLSLIFRLTHLDDGQVLYFHTLSVISDMAVGGLGAYLVINSVSFKQALTQMPRNLIAAIYCVALGLIVLRGQLYEMPAARVFERLILGAFFAFIVLDQSFCRNSFLKMGRFKRTSDLGRRTYGLYLLHPIAILALSDLTRLFGVDHRWFTGAATGFAGLAVSIGLAAVSYRYYEQAFLRLKGRFTHFVSGSDVPLRPQHEYPVAATPNASPVCR